MYVEYVGWEFDVRLFSLVALELYRVSLISVYGSLDLECRNEVSVCRSNRLNASSEYFRLGYRVSRDAKGCRGMCLTVSNGSLRSVGFAVESS